MRMNKVWFLALLGIVALAVVGCGKKKELSVSDTEQKPTVQEELKEELKLQEVMEVQESETLMLSAVYTSSIMNPDCGDKFAEDVASIEVTNISAQYLSYAELEAKLSDGSQVHFEVRDLPSGGTAEIFGTNNEVMESGVTCESVTCVQEKYLYEHVLMNAKIKLEENGDAAVVTNISEEQLENLNVVYRCNIGEQYFGGIAYECVIKSLAPGESYEVIGENLLGGVSVVRVYQ